MNLYFLYAYRKIYPSYECCFLTFLDKTKTQYSLFNFFDKQQFVFFVKYFVLFVVNNK